MSKDMLTNQLIKSKSNLHLFLKPRRIMFSGCIILIVSINLFLFHKRIYSYTSFIFRTIYQSYFGEFDKPQSLPIRELPISNLDQVHFEFYSSLPNMKLEVSDQDLEAQAHFFKNRKNVPVIKTKTNILFNQNETLFNSDQLERDFYKSLTRHAYIIQLGVFENLSVAQKFQTKLLKAGLSASVVAIKDKNKTIYRVQQGPFYSQQQVKLHGEQLQKNRVAYLVRAMLKDRSSKIETP